MKLNGWFPTFQNILRSHLLDLKLGQTVCPKTSVMNCQLTPCKIPEKWRLWKDVIQLDWGSSGTLDLLCVACCWNDYWWTLESSVTLLQELQTTQGYWCKLLGSCSGTTAYSHLLCCVILSLFERFPKFSKDWGALKISGTSPKTWRFITEDLHPEDDWCLGRTSYHLMCYWTRTQDIFPAVWQP